MPTPHVPTFPHHPTASQKLLETPNVGEAGLMKAASSLTGISFFTNKFWEADAQDSVLCAQSFPHGPCPSWPSERDATND